MDTDEQKKAEERFIAERRDQLAQFYATVFGKVVKLCDTAEATAKNVGPEVNETIGKVRHYTAMAVGLHVKRDVINSGMSDDTAFRHASEIGAEIFGIDPASVVEEIRSAWRSRGWGESA